MCNGRNCAKQLTSRKIEAFNSVGTVEPIFYQILHGNILILKKEYSVLFTAVIDTLKESLAETSFLQFLSL